MGRPRVPKHYLKGQAKVVKEVIKGSMKTIISRNKDIDEGVVACPSSLSSSVAPWREKIDQAKERHSTNDGSNLLEEMLSNFLDNKLSATYQ